MTLNIAGHIPFATSVIVKGCYYPNEVDRIPPTSLDILDTVKIYAQRFTSKRGRDGLLKNKTFLVTGKLNGISRAEVKTLIEENSGKTVSSVSNKLNYLLIGDKPTKKKIDSAKQLKINVIDQAEFLKMLNKTS